MPYPLCQHTMISGWTCGSPALTGQTHCYYHDSLTRALPKPVPDWQCYRNQEGDRLARIPMPLLEDATSLQTAYMQIIHGVLSGQLDLARSRVALAAVKAAARNLSEVKHEQLILSRGAKRDASGYDVPDDPSSDTAPVEELDTAPDTEEFPLSYREAQRRMQNPDALVGTPVYVGTEDPLRKHAVSAAEDDAIPARDLTGD